jgi:hypothetical protein
MTVGGWVTGTHETVKPFVSDTTSFPVVTVTAWPPKAAVIGIVMLAVRLVALATATLLTVISEPKLTWLGLSSAMQL